MTRQESLELASPLQKRAAHVDDDVERRPTMSRVVARAPIVAMTRPRASRRLARDAHRASSRWGVSTMDVSMTKTRATRDDASVARRGDARSMIHARRVGVPRESIARGASAGDDAGDDGDASVTPPPATTSEDEATTTTRPTAVWMTMTTLRRTIERAPRALALALAAGVWSQSVNLGGTFILALFRAHETPAVAAVFALAVAVWKFACSTYVRIAVLRGTEGSDERSRGTTRFGFGGDAWDVLKASRGALRSVVVLDLRRTLSIAWNSLITIPIPYLGLIRLLDFAVAAPVTLMEDVKAGAALKRSQELMYGYRILLMKTVFLCSTVCAMLVGAVIGAFILFVPTLPSVMMPPVDPVTGVRAAGDVAAGFINGAAFDRVWVVGTPVERTATMLLLVCGLALSFLFTLGLRELVRLFYFETKARYSPPPPEDPNEKKPSPFARLRFWKRGGEPKADSRD